MSQRVPLWAAEAEMDEDLNEVDLNLAIGNYGQNGELFDEGELQTVHNRWADRHLPRH